jgi:membrane-associated protease RseP (regulator of RpoE activity)
MMGDPTHDVGELWRRARALEAMGADVVLSHRPLTSVHYPVYDAGAFHVVPERHPTFTALRVVDLSHGFAAAAGVSPGDLVLAVNGYPMSSHADVARAFSTAKEEDAAVVEIWRNGRRFVLFIDVQPRMR